MHDLCLEKMDSSGEFQNLVVTSRLVQRGILENASLLETWLEKVGNWGTWFPGNLVIWREIYESETKIYIRNVGKYCNLGGKFYHVPGKSNTFSSHGWRVS